MDSALGLWRAYGPAVMGGLSRTGAGEPASSPPSASSTSLQPNGAPNAERRPSNSSVNSTGTPDPHSAVASPFPEPQHS
jgi:receptor expression-enhancing protein 1/2/3/4